MPAKMTPKGYYNSLFQRPFSGRSAMSIKDFVKRIERMNRVMKVSCPDQLTDLERFRVDQFQNVLMEEVREIDEILKDRGREPMTEEDFVALADWLGDIVVYTFSEARRWGIPLMRVLKAIMDSQDSKLDENGQPIHCEKTGKFLKGPNYKPPEPEIHRILFSQDSTAEEDGMGYEPWRAPSPSYSGTCKTCDKPIHKNNRTGFCPDCYQDSKKEENEVVGLVIPFPRSFTGYAKILEYDPIAALGCWKYVLTVFNPLITEAVQGIKYFCRPELDELVQYFCGPELDELVQRVQSLRKDAPIES